MNREAEDIRKHQISRISIFNMCGIDKNKILKECLRKLTCKGCEEYNLGIVKKLVNGFFYKIRQKWLRCKRIKPRFLEGNKDWLREDLVMVCNVQKSVGRPKADFKTLTNSGKIKRTKELRKQADLLELSHATQSSLRAVGNRAAASLLCKVASDLPNNEASKILKAYERSINLDKDLMKMSPEEALAMIVHLRLSKRQYQQMRMLAKQHRAELYPSYNDVRIAKQKCFPVEGLNVRYNKVEITLQSLLNLTTRRLLDSLKFPAEKVTSSNLLLLSKWGCDGSSGQKQYKQKFGDEGTDANLFLTCLVPIQLCAIDSNRKKILLWQNPTPSSTFYCRPLRMHMIKEDVNVSITEKQNVDSEIATLVPTLVNIEDREVQVKHELLMTMIDGKMINSLTGTASQVCYVCRASLKEMNDLDKVKQKPIDITTFSYGLSTLHSWIRFLEWLLHISYRLQLKKWQARKDDKDIVSNEKKRIQTEFQTRTGLLIDQTKQGTGTTNDGNTARRFFADSELSSEITKIDQKLIYRCSVILQTISSGFAIKADEFGIYAMDTAKLAISLYPWYHMPPAVHKVLVHGADIIQYALVPIGQLSEEAQESRNKDYRRYRQYNSRKCDRLSTNTDIFNNLLLSSDPVISSLRQKPTPKSKKFLPEAIALFDCPKSNYGSEQLTSDDESDTD